MPILTSVYPIAKSLLSYVVSTICIHLKETKRTILVQNLRFPLLPAFGPALGGPAALTVPALGQARGRGGGRCCCHG